jgi:Undecaprenyl-phosphate galactose phosphotransferase WbaP
MTSSDFKKYYKERYSTTTSFPLGFSLFIVDAFVVFFCIMIGFFIVNLFAIHDINFKSFINYYIFLPVFLLVFAAFGLYPGIMIPPDEEVKKYATGSFISTIIMMLTIILGLIKEPGLIKHITKNSKELQLCFAFAISFIFSIIALPAFRELAKRIFSRFKWWGVPVVVYSTNNSANYIIDKLFANRHLGYFPVIILDTEINKNSEYRDIPVFSANDPEIQEIIHDFNIKVAIICDYHGDFKPLMAKYRYTIIVAKKQNNFTSTQHLKDIAGIIGFASTHNLTFKYNLLIKRFLDVFFILFFIPVLLPVFFIIAVMVKLTSPGPVFYKHKRIGKNGKEFNCLKFRSMCINSQEILEHILATDPKMKAEWEKDRKFVNDPRITKFGKILRKTSLDELPQLINILIGQMSFVGPRPVTEPELEKYGEYKDYVLSVDPGLTGMWQISGRSDTGYEERISFDTYYIQNWSIWLDVWILIKTVWVVIKGKGAY